MAEERKEIVRLMNEIMEGWQEMGSKDKVVCVVYKACEKEGYAHHVSYSYALPNPCRDMWLMCHEHQWKQHTCMHLVGADCTHNTSTPDCTSL